MTDFSTARHNQHTCFSICKVCPVFYYVSLHLLGIQSTTAHKKDSKQGLTSPKSLYLCICEDAVHAHRYCHHLCCVQGPACLLCRCRGSACSSSRVSKGYAGHLGYPLRDPLSASTNWHVLPGRINAIKRSNT